MAAPSRFGALSPTEEVLANIWSDVLATPRFGVSDNFFELGGNSLLAVRATNLASLAFRKQIPLPFIFEAPTVSGLAHRVDALSDVLVPERPAAKRAASALFNFPPAITQEKRLVLEECLGISGKDIPAFNLAATLYLEGQVDATLVEQVLNELVSRHEILRAAFVVDVTVSLADRRRRLWEFVRRGTFTPGLFRYAPKESARIVLIRESVEKSAADQQGHAITDIVLRAKSTRFALDSPPLMRAILVRVRHDLALLALVVPHLAADGQSLEILKSDFRSLYEAALGSASPVALAPATQFSDFIVWQRDRLDDRSDGALEYWRQQWVTFGAGIVELQDFPFSMMGGLSDGEQIKPCRRLILVDSAQRLRRFASGLGMTPYILMLASFILALRRRTRKDSLAVWTNFANRHPPEFENTVGWFVNSHLIGVAFEQGVTGYDLLRKVRTQILNGIQYQHLPLNSLWQRFGIAPSVRPSVLFDFQLFGRSANCSKRCASNASAVEIREATLPLYNSATASLHTALHITVVEVGLEIRLVIVFNSRFAPEAIRALADDWITITDRLVTAPDSLV